MILSIVIFIKKQILIKKCVCEEVSRDVYVIVFQIS